MLCFLCGKEIGKFRSLVDRQYCCSEHRAQARLASSIVREEEEEQELWSVTRSREKARGSSSKPISVFGALTLVALLVAMFMLPSGPPGGEHYGPASQNQEKPGLFTRAGRALASTIRSQESATLHTDFRGRVTDWTTMVASRVTNSIESDGASVSGAGMPRVTHLRLWNKSTLLQNYQMDFQGQIENRSLSWAFRATDPGNYYAAKLVIQRDGNQPNAGLVHYVMLNGHEWDRVSLPLPVNLQRGVDYRIRVSVEGDRFLTYLNGQVISSWRDQRHTRGGVGFLDESDDPQKIAWVSLAERDSFVGRMLAYFSFALPKLPQ